MRLTVIAAALAIATGTAVRAQTPQDIELKKIKEIELQKIQKGTAAGLFAGWEKEILDIAPLVPTAGVRSAPFTADAVTEFTQVLGDGNRIERTFSSSIARDSKGRTRREQEVAMLGALASLQGQEPKLIVISDPMNGSEYTIDEERKTARQSSVIQLKAFAIIKDKVNNWKEPAAIAGTGGKKAWLAVGPSNVVTQPLGMRQIEGLAAEGTRTTTTIRAGEVGNVQPIEIVAERWFSKDLQMEVLISRRDPRSGDTVYRLTHIVRAEPPADLFEVPRDYTVIADSGKKMIELDKRRK